MRSPGVLIEDGNSRPPRLFYILIPLLAISIKYVTFVYIFFPQVFSFVFVGIGSSNVAQVKAYQGLSLSVRYISAPALIVTAGILIFVVEFFFYVCGCWESPNKHRCGYIFVRMLLWYSHFVKIYLYNVMYCNVM